MKSNNDGESNRQQGTGGGTAGSNHLFPRQALAVPLAMLALLAATHFVVDTVATTVNPLWPALEENLGLSTGGLLWVYVIWLISTSFTQLLFAYFGDRFGGRWLIWAGPMAAILCLSAIGLAGSPIVLAGLMVVGGLGVAAFHPEAAAAAGALLPEHRSRVMAIFALSGYLGQSLGPFYAGRLTDRLSLPGLMWTAAWALPVMALLTWGLMRSRDSKEGATILAESPAGSPVAGSSTRQTKTLLLLLAIGVLRILPALGVPLALAYILGAKGSTNEEIGWVQSMFMAGIGAGGMICAIFVRQRFERVVIWMMPLAAAPALWSLSLAEGLGLQAGVAAAGLLLGVAMPVYISYGQQLLPHGQRVASSITMGVSWGLSGALVAAAVWAFQQFDSLNHIFILFAMTCGLSSLICYWLPRTPVATRPPGFSR